MHPAVSHRIHPTKTLLGTGPDHYAPRLMPEPPTPVLSAEQVSRYETDGYLYLLDALTPQQVSDLRAVFDDWVEESRCHAGSYGETFDGRPRFDVEPGHTAESPGLRRVASPIEVSDVYLDVMRSNRALEAVAQLIGPNLRFRESKINSKLPGTATHLKYHQDFLFGPLSNGDLITVLFHLDEVGSDNGPLEVVPGSHKGPLLEHWHDGVFTGAVRPTSRPRPGSGPSPATGPPARRTSWTPGYFTARPPICPCHPGRCSSSSTTPRTPTRWPPTICPAALTRRWWLAWLLDEYAPRTMKWLYPRCPPWPPSSPFRR